MLRPFGIALQNIMCVCVFKRKARGGRNRNNNKHKGFLLRFKEHKLADFLNNKKYFFLVLGEKKKSSWKPSFEYYLPHRQQLQKQK
jgi:hypothetical protein